jgi:hypothetical protein
VIGTQISRASDFAVALLHVTRINTGSSTLA